MQAVPNVAKWTINNSLLIIDLNNQPSQNFTAYIRQMYFYILTEKGLYLRKIYRREPNYYEYELTSDLKQAGLFFKDQFKMISEIIPGQTYAGLSSNILEGNMDFRPLNSY